MPKTATKAITSSGLQPQFVSVQEAAELLRVSQVSIRRYLGQGKLKRFKVGPGPYFDAMMSSVSCTKPRNECRRKQRSKAKSGQAQVSPGATRTLAHRRD